MNLFGIGPMELAFIILIMIVVLGPKKMVETASSLGKFIRKVTKSPLWHNLMDTSKEIRDLPTKLVKEAGIEDDIAELKKTRDSITNLKNYSVTDAIGSVEVDDSKPQPPSKVSESKAESPVENTIAPEINKEAEQETE